MVEVMVFIAVVALAVLALQVLALRRAGVPRGIDPALADGIAGIAAGLAAAAAKLDALAPRIDAIALGQERGQERGDRVLRDESARGRAEAAGAATALREELGAALRGLRESIVADGRLGRVDAAECARQARAEAAAHFEGFAVRLDAMGAAGETRMEALRAVVDAKLGCIQTDNAEKLEQMRLTVDEKLQGTLDKRLGESFKLVSERLELVQRGLGEMQSLAIGVGDLKKVLSNVKARGTWGEVQVGALLEQTLTADQYARNVVTKAGSAERVEFAIKLPGRGEGDAEVVWMPVDSKFPHEDWLRLQECADKGDVEGVEASGKKLEASVKASAKTIRDKYLNPPQTTDFAVLFLPTEGLYAEIARRPGLLEALQREHRVIVAGPSNFSALLNSLQMGFRTLAISKRSSEVWKVLGAVKSEFGKFEAVLKSVKAKLDQASATIGDAEVRTRAIQRNLRDVESLPASEATVILGPEAALLLEEGEAAS